MAKALIVEIFGDARQFAGELDKAAGKTRSFGKAAGVAGAAIVGGLAYGLEKSIKAAGAMQTSTAKMDAAFKASGVNVDKFAGQIDKAESSGRSLGFSNIDVRDSLGSLIVATHSGTKAIADLSTAEDLARFKHISLGDASKILTSAMAGSTRAARQLGIQVSSVKDASNAASIAYSNQEAAIRAAFPTTSKMTEAQKKQEQAELNALKTKYADIKAQAALQDKQATAAKVIDLVSGKLHGQAQAFANTAAGGMARFHAQSEAIQENLGSALLPTVEKVTSAIADMTGFLARHNTVAKIAIGVIGALGFALLGVGIASKVAAAGQALWTVATTAATVASRAFTAAMWLLDAALIDNPIGIVIVALAALAVAIYEAWEHSATFRRIVTQAWNDVKTVTMTVFNTLKTVVTTVFNAVVGAATSVLNFFRGHWKTIAVLISGPFAPLVALATNAFGVRSALVGALGAMKNVALHVWDGLKKAWDVAWAAMEAGIVAAVAPIISAINQIAGAIKDLIGWAKSAASAIGGVFSSHGSGPPGGPRGGGPKPRPPHRAHGGSVNAGLAYMVGENGPELFVPKMSGSIIPHGAHGSSVQPSAGYGEVHVHVHAQTVIGGNMKQVARDLAYPIRDALVQIGRREPNALGGFA